MLKTALVALTLALSPTLAIAQCASEGHGSTTNACAEGQTYSETLGICITKPTS